MKNIPVTLPDRFINPFREYEKQGIPTARLQTDVPKDVHFFIKCMRQDTGTIETAINFLYAKLYNACLERGITDFTASARFEDLVVRCEFRLPEECGHGSPARSSLSATHAPDVGAGSAERNTTLAEHSGQPASVSSSGSTQRRTARRGK